MLRNRLPLALALAVALAVAMSASPGSAQQRAADSRFRWSARVAPAARIIVRTLHGEVRVRSGDVQEVEVRAVKSWRTGDPDAVSVRVSRLGPGDRDVLVCGIWSGATLECGETSYVVNNDGGNDTRLDIVVTVPRRTSVLAESINGRVHIADVGGAMRGSTVNGSVVVAVMPEADADIVVSTLNGTFRSELDLEVGGRVARRGTSRARLGAGGRLIEFSSVNGELRLVRHEGSR